VTFSFVFSAASWWIGSHERLIGLGSHVCRHRGTLFIVNLMLMWRLRWGWGDMNFGGPKSDRYVTYGWNSHEWSFLAFIALPCCSDRFIPGPRLIWQRMVPVMPIRETWQVKLFLAVWWILGSSCLSGSFDGTWILLLSRNGGFDQLAVLEFSLVWLLLTSTSVCWELWILPNWMNHFLEFPFSWFVGWLLWAIVIHRDGSCRVTAQNYFRHSSKVLTCQCLQLEIWILCVRDYFLRI